jgi:hypothetical protein
MRRVLLLVVAVGVTSSAFAGTAERVHDRPLFQSPRIDFSRVTGFGARQPDAENSDALLPRPLPPPPTQAAEQSFMPSLRVGPFHATVGGGELGRIHLGPDHMETQDFWNSTVTSGASSRGAKVMFTMPTH